ncbi:hypothetical protein D3C77_119750 [compost metagenome]
MPFCITPMVMPARMLTTMMIKPAIASPLTNFIAPSMEPNIWLSFSTLARRSRASSTSITFARRSPSILICLPGIASSENRALTSATRSAPLVMTRNWTMVMIRNRMQPTTRLPPATKLPKVWTISPASASSRIIRVVLTEMARRNKVVTSSTAGKTENCSGELT